MTNEKLTRRKKAHLILNKIVISIFSPRSVGAFSRHKKTRRIQCNISPPQRIFDNKKLKNLNEDMKGYISVSELLFTGGLLAMTLALAESAKECY